MPATFHFLLRTDQPNKQGLCSLYLRITHNRRMKYVNTGVKLDPDDWNPDKERVRKSHRTYTKVNDELEIIMSNAHHARRKLAEQKKENADAIKKLLEASSKDDFFELAEDYLDELKRAKQYHTRKQSKVAVDKVKHFHKSNHLPINLIDEEYLNKLVKFMQGPVYENKPSTIHKNMGAISGVLDLAVERRLLPFNPAKSDSFSLPKKNGTIMKAKLDFSQVQDMENMNLDPGSNMWNARNAFVLAFYFCGIRFGDLAMLRWENVKNDRLRYVMSKTGIEIDVKVPDGAKRYLECYHSPGKSDSDYIFPFLTALTKEQQKDPEYIRKRIATNNTIVNDCLKVIARELDINENLSMHVARHTFAQYAIEVKNVPTYRMMILLGHQNIKTTMQYLKTINVKVADETMDQIF
ncbi:MAG: tyrosine-type recombinase/integrase [Balneolaceae bacterium]